MKIVNKGKLIDLISKDNDILKKDAAAAIDYFIKGVEKIISRGDKLSLIGFGNFYVQNQKARTGRNPRTGEAITIKASKLPKFKAGSVLKQRCNKR